MAQYSFENIQPIIIQMNTAESETLTLDEQLKQFQNNRFLSMPISGTIAWTVIGIGSFFLEQAWASLLIFIATGSIFYLGLGVAKLTGEDLLGKTRKGNLFDKLFLSTTAMSILVFAIAIPFYNSVPQSLPMSVGILTGLMWMPFSLMIGHWLGFFHTISRTFLVVAVYYLVPDYPIAAISAVIVLIYLITIYLLAKRPIDKVANA